MPATVSLSELLEAFEWVSASDPLESAAYVSRQTGRIFWDADAASLDEELPEDVGDESLYACVPHKHDLDLGQRLVFRFVDANAPDADDQVRSFFSKRGAYARYKDLLERRGLLEAWYAYERQAAEAALRDWAASEDLEAVDGRRADG